MVTRKDLEIELKRRELKINQKCEEIHRLNRKVKSCKGDNDFMFCMGVVVGCLVLVVCLVLLGVFEKDFVLTNNETEYNNFLINEKSCAELGFDGSKYNDKYGYSCYKNCNFNIKTGEFSKYYILKDDYNFNINYDCEYFYNIPVVENGI